jgi:hypothetical protein
MGAMGQLFRRTDVFWTIENSQIKRSLLRTRQMPNSIGITSNDWWHTKRHLPRPRTRGSEPAQDELLQHTVGHVSGDVNKGS